MSVSDYPNGQAPKSVLTLWEGMWVDPQLVPELEFVKAYCEARGVSFRGTQGYRWLGVEPDRRVLDESDTSDGTANQWYVLGVEDRGGASAATPGSSNHGRGLSVDVASDGPNWQAVRDQAFNLVGWDRDVAGESWHYTKRRAATVDLSAYQNGNNTEGDDDMLEFMAEMPIQPPGYPSPGAMTTDGSKHTFYVVPAKHVFWHIKNNGQLVFYRDGCGIRFISDQGADIMLEFRLLKPGESA